MTDTRRLFLGGFTAVAASLIITGVAWACVPYYGKLQVAVSGTGADIRDTGTVEGNGGPNDGTSDHQYCAPGDTTGRTPVQEGKVTGGDTLTITIRPTTGCATNNSLTQGWNEIIFTNATTDVKTPFSMTGTSWSVRLGGTGCWASPAPAGNITLASFSLDATKSATVTRTLPNLNSVDQTNRASMLCVGKRGTDAIPVPIRVTSTT